jgi:hypothetical protein
MHKKPELRSSFYVRPQIIDDEYMLREQRRFRG